MRLMCVIGCLLTASFAVAQDSVRVRPLTMTGYIKDMQTLNFSGDFNDLITGNLIHNRLNFRYQPTKKITAGVEMRNRLFWGEEVRLVPDFSSGLPYSSEWANLAITWFETESMLLYTNIDRLWVEYATDQWNVRAGRQRINWGISTTWNPNDLFNTYNFLDFDYEERPACDAVKAHYQFSGMSFTEFAISRSSNMENNIIAAGRYFFNRSNYDVQVIGGWYLDQPTVGAGWSGSIGNAGFKGEVQYFVLHHEVIDQLNISLEADYIFSSGWYVSGGGLYNSRGLNEPISQWSVASLELSPRNPMPTQWNVITFFSKQVTPLFTASLGSVYAPKTNLLILLPGLQYNVATNLDVNLFWQSFFAEQSGVFKGLNHRVFIRFKLSF
ncbi:MAG: hypothetical protein KF846_10125 [Cyclobacteriaceae bacterium]|nr:hypothetical protein [Cyclobacteriaceae bacterium]MBX2956505.1 hypothetical protein [Cyclobacteriaceae bacterium]